MARKWLFFQRAQIPGAHVANEWVPSSDGLKFRRGSFFKKSLVIVLMITCLPAALIGVSFYFIGTAQIEQEVNATHSSQLEKARKRIDEQLAHIELTASQWSLNPLFNERLKTADLNKQFIYTQDLFRALFIIKGSSTLIEQVYLYMGDQQLLVSEDEGVRQLPSDQNAFLQAQLSEKPSMHWTKMPVKKDAESLSLIHALANGGLYRYGGLIIILNETKVNEMVRELTTDKEESSSFLFKESGEWITTGIDGVYAPTVQELSLSRSVRQREAPADSFISRWNKENYSVSYGRLSQEGGSWVYVTASPVNQLIRPVLVMSRMILAVSGLGLAAAVLLAWLGSERLYRPIRRLVQLVKGAVPSPAKQVQTKDELTFIESQWKYLIHESNDLQDRLEEQLPTLREGFMLQLVQGHLYAFKEKELRERMLRFGWSVEDRCFSIMVIRLAGAFHSGGKFAEKDKQLITFAAANIIEELSGNQMDVSSVINFQDLTIGLLVAYPIHKPWKQFKSDLFKLADELTVTMNALLKLHVIVSIGKTTENVGDIPNVLQEVRQMMLYRDLEENNQILDMDEIVPRQGDASYYPFQVEKELQIAVRRGDITEAVKLADSFLGSLSRHGVTEFAYLQSVLYLLGNILQTMIQMGFNPHQLYRGENLYEQLLGKRERDEIRRWLRDKVLEPFGREYWESQDAQLKAMIKQTMDMIAAHYMNDISLEHCADQLGVHPVRLSKGFKQVAGSTFIDYLTMVRIEKSKELLRTTDWKIHRIAQTVGYQPSYFNKIFRKQEGVSASEFRSLSKE
ncbi:helix-turn-helix transcriptional regulator [Paenibacillus piri]|uniref:AraC family transcriptional regulator n=1 Tax=Paenibacillus piri TaxID=2547395 RepID=A0A4R5K8G6_9BACL|nr:AraC family transcriptional regulator [Paenibacillus piri]TDF91229.1 AraC family transcriptional regulator [Paenibacillus piri]